MQSERGPTVARQDDSDALRASAIAQLTSFSERSAMAMVPAGELAADIEQARKWYQKAASLGAAEATRRLQILANR